MPRPSQSEPISVLRAALSGPFPTVRRAAERLIERALRQPTIGKACEELGVSRRAFERLREDFPEVLKRVRSDTAT